MGEIAATDVRWLDAIWKMGAVPVISSMALGYDGEYYNINADEMASATAAATKADALVFLTDVPGVKGADGQVMRWLSLKEIPRCAAGGCQARAHPACGGSKGVTGLDQYAGE